MASRPSPLAATVRGIGPVVLLLHGFAQDGRSMAGLQERLSQGFSAVAVDLPGHGRSLAQPADTYVKDTVFALYQLLDRLGAAQAAMVGYSFGARLAARAALEQPARCWALVLESMALLAPPKERQERLEADRALSAAISVAPIADFVARWERQPVFASQEQVEPARLSLQRRIRMSQDPAGLAAALAGGGQAVSGLGPEQLRSLKVPTLVMAGSRDPTYLRHLEGLTAAISGAEGAVLEGCGHNLELEAEQEASERIWAFLSRVSDQRRAS